MTVAVHMSILDIFQFLWTSSVRAAAAADSSTNSAYNSITA